MKNLKNFSDFHKNNDDVNEFLSFGGPKIEKGCEVRFKKGKAQNYTMDSSDSSYRGKPASEVNDWWKVNSIDSRGGMMLLASDYDRSKTSISNVNKGDVYISRDLKGNKYDESGKSI